MAVKFKPAPEVEEVAKPIIDEFYPDLNRHHAKIVYLFRDKVEKLRGSACAATARLTTGLNAYLVAMGEDFQDIEDREEEDETSNSESVREPGTPFFVISVFEPGWRFMSVSEREALMDHELHHCGADFDDKGRSKFWIMPHDLEEFNKVYGRRGPWNGRIRAFLKAGMPKEDDGQMPLDFDGESAVNTEPPAYLALSDAGRPQIGAGSSVLAIEGGPKQIEACPVVIPDDATIDAEFKEVGAGGVDGEEDGDEGFATPQPVREFLERERAKEVGATEDDIPGLRRPRRIATKKPEPGSEVTA